jgi:chitin disaccharide deacetylase
MMRERSLLIIADDFGIGPQTSRAILDLAAAGRVTGTVLLVNSPYAEHAVQTWRTAGCQLEVGWHPCLTLDRPILAPAQVASLIDRRGYFHSLDQFMRRLFLGKIDLDEVESELRAQLERFIALTGREPTLVNFHHHLHVFTPICQVVCALLSGLQHRPYLRRVAEEMHVLIGVPGGRAKRAFLSWHGKRAAANQAAAGLSSNEYLAGISTPGSVHAQNYLTRWISAVGGAVVELTCHPGYWDETLVGRDCSADDGRLLARTLECQHLADDRFVAACRQAGFAFKSVGMLAAESARRVRHVA